MAQCIRYKPGIVSMVALLLVCGGTADAALNGVNLFTTTVYNQTSMNVPVNPFGYYFAMGGNFQTAGEYNSGTASFPAGSLNLGVAGTRLNYTSGIYSSLTNLHSDFAFGVYTVTARHTLTLAQKSGVINYTSDDFTTAIPAASPSTYQALVGMNPAVPFSFQFNAHAANPNNNEAFTVLTIFQGSSNSIVYTTPFLPASSTSHVIPASSLAPNTLYRFDVIFTDRAAGTDAVNGVGTFRGFDVRTNGYFTTGAVPEPALLGWVALTLLGMGRVRKKLA